jgi:hypothetical protein
VGVKERVPECVRGWDKREAESGPSRARRGAKRRESEKVIWKGSCVVGSGRVDPEDPTPPPRTRKAPPKSEVIGRRPGIPHNSVQRGGIGSERTNSAPPSHSARRPRPAATPRMPRARGARICGARTELHGHFPPNRALLAILCSTSPISICESALRHHAPQARIFKLPSHAPLFSTSSCLPSALRFAS